MAVKGKVITGYSQPEFITYPVASGTITALGRGVSVQISAEVSDAVKWYANNTLGETATGIFNNGTLSMELDGLQQSAVNTIFGHVTTDSWCHYNKADTVNEVAVGFIVRFENSLGTKYTPVILPIVKFKETSLNAATQTENVEFQASTLEGTVLPNSSKIWKYVGGIYSTESEAATAMVSKMQTLVR